MVAESAPGTLLELAAVSPPIQTPLPSGVAAPIGAFTFKVSGVAQGGLTTVRLTFPAGVPASAWWKYDPGASTWTEFACDAATGTGSRVVSASVLELVLADGGRGDADGQADGVVNDPGAPVLPVLVIDDAGDAPDLDPGDGVCAVQGSGCTLRAAIMELNASGAPHVVRFAFTEPAVIAPNTALPPLSTPIVLDASAVPGPDAAEPGLTLSGASLGSAASLLQIAAGGSGLIGVKLVDVDGDALSISAPRVRIADSWIGRPLFGGGEPRSWASIRAEGAHHLHLVGLWVGRTHLASRFGIHVSISDEIHMDDVRVNIHPKDGLRPNADIPVGLSLDDTPRGRLSGLVVHGAETGVEVRGDQAGTQLRKSLFGLGTNGRCNAFTRDDPGPAETGRGPCLDRNLHGLVLDGADGLTVGGLDVLDRNFFGDHFIAIEVKGGIRDNAFYNNYVGLAADGTCQPAPPFGVETLYDGLCRLYNGSGLLVSDGSDNRIGTSGAGNVFGVGPLELGGAAVADNRVEGNWLGLFGDLRTPVRPGFTASAPAILHISGGASGTRVEGNTLSGVVIEGIDTADTVVTENRIGLLSSGLALPGPDTDFSTYWRIWPVGVTVRDGAPRTRLVDNDIASTVGACVRIEGTSEAALVEGNRIGLTTDARAPTACFGGGIDVRASAVATLIAGNLFGACGEGASDTFQLACARVGGGASATVLDANIFGLTRDGRDGPWSALVPYDNPVVILEDAPATRVEGNTLLGGRPHAIYDRAGFLGNYQAPSDGVTLASNRIGLDPDGALRGAPPGDAILAVGPFATVGEPGEGNVIRGAGGAGVRVGNVAGVRVRGNVIGGNAGLGISLGDGFQVVPNDTGDGDGGPNQSQNFPILGAFSDDPPTVAVTLGSRPDTSYLIDVYGVASADPSGHGEADVWLGAATLVTDAAGAATGSVALSRAPLPGERLTATATGPDGTSEFGPAVRPDALGSANLIANLYVEPAGTGAWGFMQPSLQNFGPDTATDVVVEIDIPPGVELGSNESLASGTCVPVASGLRCDGFDLARFGTWDGLWYLRAQEPGAYPITVRASSRAVDPQGSNDSISEDFRVGSVGFLLTAQLRDFKSNWTTAEVAPIDYTIHRQFFNAAIPGLELEVEVPAGTALVGGTHPCTLTGTTVRCDVGTLPAGQPSMPVTVELIFAATGTLEIRGSATATGPNNEGDTLAIVYPTLTAAPPGLSLSLTAPGAAVAPGTRQRWTATVGNAGANALDGLVVTVAAPRAMVLRGADAPCARLGDAVLCLPPAVPASGSLPIALDFDAPSGSTAVTACARRVDGDRVLEEACATGEALVSGVDRGVSAVSSVQLVEAGSLATVAFTVSSATGAGAVQLRIAAEGAWPAAVFAPGCTADAGELLCDVPPLAPGQSVAMGLELLVDTPEAYAFTASLEGATDGDPSNDLATARLFVSGALDCGAYEASVLLADTPATPLLASGFNRETPLTPLGVWALSAGAATLSTGPLTVPDGADSVHIAWRDIRALGAASARLEVSEDGGVAWRPLAELSDDEAPEWQETLVEVPRLGVGGELRVRWVVEGAPSPPPVGTLRLGAARVVACVPGGELAALSLVADPAWQAVGRGGEAVTVFTVTHSADTDLRGAEVVLNTSHADAIRAIDVAGGSCALEGATALCALPDLTPGADAQIVVEGALDADARVLLDARLVAPVVSAGVGPVTAAATWRIGEPDGEGAALAWEPASLTFPPGQSATASLRVSGVGQGASPAGRVRIVAPPGTALTTPSAGCVAAADGLTCALPLVPPGDVAAIDITFTPLGLDRTESVVAVHDAGADAELSMTLRSEGGVSLAFDGLLTPPAALEPAFATLVVEAEGGAIPGAVVRVRARPGVDLRSVTGEGASCAGRPDELVCDISPLAAGEALPLTVDFIALDAGAHGLEATVLAGRSGAAPTAALFWRSTRDCLAHPCDAAACDGLACDPALGCVEGNVEGGACDAGADCGRQGVCAGGDCVASGDWQCDDANDCTSDSCGSDGACVFEPAAGPCALECFSVASCEAGVCVGEVPEACDDEDPCTTDACVSGQGCVHTFVSSPECDCSVRPGTQRCDGAALVILDGCGVEVSRVACTDGDDCTSDGCSDATGCTFLPSTAPGCPGCVPACDGRACGVDPVCGVACGTCDSGEACLFGACIPDPCDEMPAVGCCDDGRAARCEGGVLVAEDCEGAGGCGWREADGRWGCGGSDPAPTGDGGFCPWGPECSEAAHCDDADDCTSDRCQDGACVHDEDPQCLAEPGPEPLPEPAPELPEPPADEGPEAVESAPEAAPETVEAGPDAASEPSPESVAESDLTGSGSATGCGGCAGGGGSGAADWLWLLFASGLAQWARRRRSREPR